MVKGRTVSREEFGIADTPLPQHIAIIMDGNGRWAKQQGLSRSLGHKEGSENLEVIAGAACNFGIPAVSVYAFSTENWKRPAAEIQTLFRLIEEFINRGFPPEYRDRIKMKISGDLSKLPSPLRDALIRWCDLTKNNTEMVLNICLNYGGRDDITRAARHIAEKVSAGELRPSEITENMITENLYSADMPEVDLLIRTSGELRLSNYMLWQIAYAEIVVVDKYWPDFNPEDLANCIKQFQSRNRRFGGVVSA